MGRGRAPCCDKSKVKTGPWSPAEDLRLISFIHKNGYSNWRSLPIQAGLSRCGKSCRLRWINYLRPDVKRGNFTNEEEETIIKLHQTLGNKWSKIASYLPGRTDNEIKNVWNTHLKKRLAKKDEKNHKNQTNDFSRTSSFSTSSTSSFMSSYANNEGTEELVLDEGQEGLANKSYEPKEDIPTTDHDHELKESSSSSNSSISCDASDYSNSSARVDVSMPEPEPEPEPEQEEEEEEGSLFNLGGPCEADNATIAYDQVNNNSDDHQVIEIPLEDSDIDFWDMLDNLADPFQSIDESPQLPQELVASQSSNYDHHTEIEYCREWLRDLENELGLVEATSDGVGQLGSEIDHAKCYFQTWPSPPQNFGV
ncbi:unnamed protein product [Camellia sinensis]